MSVIEYASRKAQIDAFKRELVRGLPTLTPGQHAALRFTLRDAAMVGAAEERHRTLEILKNATNLRDAAEKIMASSELQVLGYE